MRRKILMVEDMRVDSVMRAERVFAQHDFELISVADVREALECLEQIGDEINVAIVDIQLKEDRSGGYEVARACAKCDIPVIFVTAHSGPSTHREAAAVGCYSVLPATTSAEILLEHVIRAMNDTIPPHSSASGSNTVRAPGALYAGLSPQLVAVIGVMKKKSDEWWKHHEIMIDLPPKYKKGDDTLTKWLRMLVSKNLIEKDGKKGGTVYRLQLPAE